MADANNKKYPDSQVAAQYPYAKATVHPDGSGRYEDHTPGYETFREFFSAGGHREVSNSPDGGAGREVVATLGKAFHNLADGLSHAVGGHKDEHVAGNHRHNIDGDHHEEKGGNHYESTTGHKIKTSNDTQIEHTGSGDKHQMTSGDQVTSHEGDVHSTVTGDIIEHVGGHKATFIEGGDYGINIQAGNLDISSDVGKVRLWSLDKAVIESLSSITLKVGPSTIVIDNGGITITAPAVSFVKA